MDFQSIFSFVELNDFSNGDVPSWVFILMLLISLFYGLLLHFLYSIYFKENEPLDASLSRSLILLTPTLMTVFWIIHVSIPLSVGLLGVLSFVRFRSPVKRAEDVAFIVICLACALSCAIMKPLMGGSLVFLFLSFSLVRNYLNPNSINGNDFAVLTFNTKIHANLEDIEAIFKKSKCRGFEFVSSRAYDGITSFVFNMSNLKKTTLTSVMQKLEDFDKSSNINVFYPNGRLGS